MGLKKSEIQEILKSPKQRIPLQKAIKHERRLRFHTESYMDASEIKGALSDFLNWVKGLIPKDKYNVFLSLFTYPTPVVQETSLIFNELERVFDGKNPAFDYQFTDPEFRSDWEKYRTRVLHEPDVWRKKAWDKVKSAINSVLVVDLPTEQTGDFPEPYFYFQDISTVIAYDYDKNNYLYNWIIFSQGEDKIVVLDNERYRAYSLDKEKRLDKEIVNTPHDLGYCPARPFWTTELSAEYPENKKAPISPQLGKLDWLLFFMISKQHLDLYAPYPIYSAYEADCDFENNQTGEYCDGGFLRDKDQHYKMLADGHLMECPVCAEKRIAGAGSFIEVPLPKSREDVDLRDPVQITSVDSGSLKYNVEEVKRLIAEIFSHVVGLGGEVQEKTSLSDLHVTANFESKKTVLNNLKRNLERAQKFVDDTVCRLRYGERFISSSISYGTEFYIFSIEDLHKRYEQAKKNGASEAQLDAMDRDILETEYKDDPVQLERMITLRHLEPYRHYTLDELMRLSDKQLLDPQLLSIKINFNRFVDKFERENVNILDFGSKMAFRDKINKISETLKSYERDEKNQLAGEKQTGGTQERA